MTSGLKNNTDNNLRFHRICRTRCLLRRKSSPFRTSTRRATCLPTIALLGIALSVAHPIGAAEHIGGVVLLKMDTCCPQEAWPEAEESIVSELSLENIPVTQVESRAENRQERLDEMRRIAQHLDAAAVIRIVRTLDGQNAIVDLWLEEAMTDRSSYRQIGIPLTNAAASTLDVAVRTVEALRATFVESQLSAPTEVATTEAAVPLPVESVFPRFAVGAVGSVLITPKRDGGGIRGGFGISGILEPVKGLDLEVSFVASPFGGELYTPQVTSSVDLLFLRTGLFYRFENDSIVTPSIGLSGGALLANAEGRNPFTDEVIRHDKKTVGYLGGHFRLFIKATPALRIQLGISAGATLPELVVAEYKDGGAVAARFGRPLIEGELGVQVRFP